MKSCTPGRRAAAAVGTRRLREQIERRRASSRRARCCGSRNDGDSSWILLDVKARLCLRRASRNRRRSKCPRRASRRRRGRRARAPCLGSRRSARGARPAPISHCASPACRLPVTGSSFGPAAADERAHLELRLAARRAAARRRRCPAASRLAKSGFSASSSSREPSMTATQPGPLSTHCDARIALRVDAQAARDRRRASRASTVAAAPQRRRREREPLAVAAHAHEADAALLHDLVARARLAAGREPRVAGAERRMARERQLARSERRCARGSRPSDPSAAAGTSSRSSSSSARTSASSASDKSGRVVHDGERVALERLRREDVDGVVAIASHGRAPAMPAAVGAGL